MRTIDDIPVSYWPSPLPLDVTPRWQRILLRRPMWRFWFSDEFWFANAALRPGWVYLTAKQYERIFKRRAA